MATAGLLLVAACGGGSSDSGTDSSGGSGNSGGGSGSSGSSGSGSGSGDSANGGSSGSGMSCSTPAPVLHAAQNGTISATFLSAGTASTFSIMLIYDNLGGQSINNPQDKFGGATLFDSFSNSQVGSTVTVTYRAFEGTSSGPFPQGTPIMLSLGTGAQEPSTTGGIDKDVRVNANAQVMFGANNTATVTFVSSGSGSFSVGLTNVSGTC
jgi:hypothetical protein